MTGHTSAVDEDGDPDERSKSAALEGRWSPVFLDCPADFDEEQLSAILLIIGMTNLFNRLNA